MVDLRPTGTADRAWNDPPPLEFNQEPPKTSSINAKPKNILNKRVPFPQTGFVSPSETPKVTENLNSLPPAGNVAFIGNSATSPVVIEEITTTEVVAVHTTLNRLHRILTECHDSFQARTYDDVMRRMAILRSMWIEEKLNDVIQRRLNQLSKDLASGKYEDANRIHLSLLVDYPGLVSSWMVGIKHIIQQAKSANFRLDDDEEFVVGKVEGQDEVEVEDKLTS